MQRNKNYNQPSTICSNIVLLFLCKDSFITGMATYTSFHINLYTTKTLMYVTFNWVN